MSKVGICGLGIDALTAEGALDAVSGAVRARRAGDLRPPLAVFPVNVDLVVKAARDPAFARDLAAADLLLADGVPVLWMARGLGAALPERVAGSDLVPLLAGRAAAEGFSLFFLGGAPGVAEAAVARLRGEHPRLRVAGTLSPPPGFDADPAALEAAVAAVAAARPDVVLVALGAPRQERFAIACGARLGCAAVLAVGGTFDFLAGRRRRAPRLLQRAGLEWAWRLSQEPLRLGRRYLVDDAAIVPLYARALWRRWAGGVD
ncbi:WecB/TagA/CpsF family glycosyltransferase [Anaeromyxobacter paludicola]|uniref:Glycosyl transferase, WecB/TagA/CpsF family n=1 Tax=Anaeromyxobacter paludicola TaxID=2918171 RepID=A0ABN6N525_9BACT|nr:WecB/TagA/CpsF family glycosyltransferase [Anaeromyxobacter paludicola]BDG07158.1 hypothetical protein AMPC_02710 [Anaeromyxobacter paludicola]